MAKEKIIQLQLVLFFDSNESRPDKLISKIDDVLDGIFDKMPTILPIPQDAPPEIPSVMMQSSNGMYVCNIARARIDFAVNYASSNNSSSVQLDDFIEKIRPFAALMFGYKNITRFGLVGQYFFKNVNPISKIQTKYLKNNLGDLEELNIRYNKRFEEKDLILNDILDVSKGTFVENGRGQQDGILIQRDMNNVPVESLKIEDVISVIVSKKDKFKLSTIIGLV